MVNDRFVSSNAYVLVAALGGSFITAAATVVTVYLTARRESRAAQVQRRLQSYADLLVAAGDVLGTGRQIWETVREFNQSDADEANKRMADLASALHRASAVVALTGSSRGRASGNYLYAKAHILAATRVVPSSNPGRQYTTATSGSESDVARAIDDYKADLLPEISALP